MKLWSFAVASALLLAVPAFAQEPASTTSCAASIRYPDGRIPNPRNLQIGESVVYEGVTVPIFDGMLLEDVCRIAAPMSARIAQAQQDAAAARRQLAIEQDVGRANKARLAAIESDLVRSYPYEIAGIALIAGFLLAFVLLLTGKTLWKLLRFFARAVFGGRRQYGRRGAFASGPRGGTFLG